MTRLRSRLARAEDRLPTEDARSLAAERAKLRALPPGEIAARYQAMREEAAAAPRPAWMDGLTTNELVARYRALCRTA